MEACALVFTMTKDISMIKYAVLFLLFATPAFAQSDVVLQVDDIGRNDVKRHRLIVFDTAPGGQDVMMALSCRADDYTLGGVIDFGRSASDWSIDGEDLDISYDEQTARTFRFTVSEEFLL